MTYVDLLLSIYSTRIDPTSTTQELHASLVAPLPAGAHLVAVLDTGLTRAGTGSGPAKGSLARLRNASASARARAASLSLSLSIPAPAQDMENLTADAVGPVLPALSKLTWILPDEEAHCESPVGQFPCNGWCRNLEGHSTCVAPDADDEVKADVVSLASCKDSQLAWEPSMTSVGLSFFRFLFCALLMRSRQSLVDLLRENPHQSLKDVLIQIRYSGFPVLTLS
jgi:hypothetical protein